MASLTDASNAATAGRKYLLPFLGGSVGIACYLLTIPFYTFPSGIPQPSDFILALTVAFVALGWIWNNRLPLQTSHQLPAGIVCLLVLYVWLVDLTWSAALGTPRIIIYPLFYAFNLLAFVLVLALRAIDESRLFRVVGASMAASLLLQATLSLVVPTTFAQTGEREVLFFNNPNQLAYYALLGACIVCLLRSRGAVGPLAYALGLLAAMWLCALSLSKGALVSLALLLVFELLKGRAVLPALLITGLCVAFAADNLDLAVLDRVWQRLGSIGLDRDDSLAGRGYDRIWVYPWYLIFGGGEGEFSRFAHLGAGAREIHSTVGTLFFSYGIPGVLIVSCFGLLLVSQSKIGVLLYVVPPLTYGLTHNGLRETLLWILVALVIGNAGAAQPRRIHG